MKTQIQALQRLHSNIKTALDSVWSQALFLSVTNKKSQNKPYGLLWFFVCLFITNLKREVVTIKKKNLNYANCVSRLSTGAVVLNGFEKLNLKQPTITHIFIPHQIGTLVFSKITI